MKYIIEMPEHWGPGNCPHCRVQKCRHWRIGRVIVKYDCPLANAKEAVEVRLVEDNEVGAGIIDAKGQFYHEEDTLYTVSKEAKNGKV